MILLWLVLHHQKCWTPHVIYHQAFLERPVFAKKLTRNYQIKINGDIMIISSICRSFAILKHTYGTISIFLFHSISSRFLCWFRNPDIQMITCWSTKSKNIIVSFRYLLDGTHMMLKLILSCFVLVSIVSILMFYVWFLNDWNWDEINCHQCRNVLS